MHKRADHRPSRFGDWLVDQNGLHHVSADIAISRSSVGFVDDGHEGGSLYWLAVMSTSDSRLTYGFREAFLFALAKFREITETLDLDSLERSLRVFDNALAATSNRGTDSDPRRLDRVALQSSPTASGTFGPDNPFDGPQGETDAHARTAGKPGAVGGHARQRCAREAATPRPS